MNPRKFRHTLHAAVGRWVIGSTRMIVAALLVGLVPGALFASDLTVPRESSVPAWRDGQQLIVVVSPDWDSSAGNLRRYQRIAGAWTHIGTATPVTLGRNGSAWGVGLHPAQIGKQKREGDGRAPAGLFAIGSAFGYEPSATTGLDYVAMRPSHHCVDVSTSPHYNRIVDTDDVGLDAIAGSTEPMRRDLHLDGDPVYRLGFVIAHNEAGVADAGSCIFAHLWRSADAPTAGCTAMADAAMDALLAWLDRERAPRFLLLPRAEYLARVEAWGLPPLDGG